MASIVIAIPDNLLSEVLDAFADNKPEGITKAQHAKREIRGFVINKLRAKRAKEASTTLENNVTTDTQDLDVS